MRWNALPVLALTATLVLAGCSRHVVKTEADLQSTAAYTGDFYTPAPPEEEEEEASQADAYLDYATPSGIGEPALGSNAYLAGTTGQRFHVVAKKETLYALARMYYSDAGRWKDIFEANRGTIDDPNRILIGQRLLIP